MARSAPLFEPVTIEAEGALLAGRYHATTSPVSASLVLHGATGVPQGFYKGFVRWAGLRGIAVLTYDYRDFGASRRGPMRASRATMADWLILDQMAAESRLVELAPDGPLWHFGHSIGGLGFPFRDPGPRVERIVTVGAGFAHFSDHPWNYRPTALAFWYGPGPLATAIAGYLPGRRLLLGADLPAGVYWQWRRWCTRRDFYSGDFGKTLPTVDFARSGPPIRIATVCDDVVVPPAAVWRYADTFASSRVTRVELKPRELGLTALGHIQVMAERNEVAWPAILGIGT